MLARNLKYTTSDGLSIDMEIEHPAYGWVPFTASPNDVELYGRELYAQAVAGTLGTVTAYAAPQNMSLTPRQIRLVLNAAGLRTQVEQAVAASTQDVRDMWEFSLEYLRDDPVLVAMAAQIGITSIQLDAMFNQGAAL